MTYKLCNAQVINTIGILSHPQKLTHPKLQAPHPQKQINDGGYDSAYGARPLKRTIQQRMGNRLATELLAGRFTDGDKIQVDSTGHAFTFEKI